MSTIPPNFRVSPAKVLVDSLLAGGPLPVVTVEDFKSYWAIHQSLPTNCAIGSRDWLQSQLSPGANLEALTVRYLFVKVLLAVDDFAPWHSGDDLDERVFQVAATFAIDHKNERHPSYTIIDELRKLNEPN